MTESIKCGHAYKACMYRVMFRFPLLIQGEMRQMIEREYWRTYDEGEYLRLGNRKDSRNNIDKNDGSFVMVPMDNVLGMAKVNDV